MEEKRPRPEDQEAGAHERALFQCADLILPWLHSAELAATSSTCKTLNHICRSIIASRFSDAARGFEPLPIPFVNAVDHHPYAYFLYTPAQAHWSDSVRDRQAWGSTRTDSVRPERLDAWVGDACGCECERCDGDSGCPCSDLDSAELARECGPSCRCSVECGNRVTQGGISVRLKIVRDKRKGWGLCADERIGRGQFVCEYTGELLTTEEARRRQQRYDQLASGGWFSCALLVVREHLPSGKACMRMNIDATVMGNVSRFINHSCDGGNLSTVIVRSSGALLPRLCFFASRDIQKDEELTFSYGEIRLRSKGLQCFCDSHDCFRILPSENT
ncbi:histone-lysine N-methyltransferase SUVR3 [Actinidia eriantha]|uniref:histone-lysine N-methyltransferase SUVR3 n=1 Tax=Actinidia eriantha TaxID=165200 RepID=UPI00258B943C|nr:histone-lysine N-methyltransferase SUVR3 [Actinidia eriantha]XP_057506088.1 histone-lysine N-methyltransferase SUVR3 [Actinidia eriantha]XP_057506089.1 histone-lysine N-methyltransferase SUVR3 [Actinidia eriantha]XP_057506090.1 histone-lysine N-methyltransferase SUVR3 [Actinidia eriantha]XP_057506091.1 histone-lysine N-methyltransferase SUVR3 [Actinidia eriantha]XP_057506092.1 histone-lysine N-methyltransferase SUVR3 [Actinidia eriantha]